MLNYVNRTLIGKASGAANTGNSVATMALGDLLLVGIDGVPLTAATAAVADEAYVLQGTARVGFPIKSSRIIKRTIKNSTKQVYSPAVAQVDTLNLAQLTAGKQVIVTVLFKDEHRLIANRQTRKEVAHSTPASGFVLNTEVAKLAAKINKDQTLGRYLVAAASGATITLTGLPIFVNSSVLDRYDFVSFESAVHESIPDGHFGSGIAYPVAQTTAAFSGEGLPVLVMEAEHDARGYLGVTDNRSFERNRPALFASEAVTGGGYDTYHVPSFDEHEGDLQFQVKTPVLTSVYVATGSVQAAYIEQLLESFIQSKAADTVDEE